jgi:hypothetical protein
MARCNGIKGDGERCRLAATGPHGFCWAHAPENADKRRRMASRAARGKGNREVRDLKADLRQLIADVRAGDLDRSDAAVMVQAYRAIRELIALERQIRETDQLAAEVEELRRLYGLDKAS